MNVSPIHNDFVRMTNKRYELDTNINCAICGYGIYRGEQVAWNKNDEVCHAECIERCAKL